VIENRTVLFSVKYRAKLYFFVRKVDYEKETKTNVCNQFYFIKSVVKALLSFS